jgi:hypothetical protein
MAKHSPTTDFRHATPQSGGAAGGGRIATSPRIRLGAPGLPLVLDRFGLERASASAPVVVRVLV